MPTDAVKMPQIDPALLERLGCLVVWWAFVETLVADLFVATLTRGNATQPIDPGTLAIVTKNVSQATLTDWIRTMIDVRYTPANEAKKIRDLLNEVDELRAERNALVHGLWGNDRSPPGTAMVQTIRLERREMIHDLLITPTDLDVLIERTLDVIHQLLAFLIRHDLPHKRMPTEVAPSDD